MLSLWQLSANELYLARVSAVRAVELSRLVRSMAVVLGGMLIVLRLYNTQATQVRDLILGSVLSLLLLLVGRSIYRAYLDTHRRRGEFVRDVLIIGSNHEAAEMVELLRDHPETGYRVAGVVGSRMEALANNLEPPLARDPRGCAGGVAGLLDQRRRSWWSARSRRPN